MRLYRGNKGLIMNDYGHLRNSFSHCIHRLDMTPTAMATALETTFAISFMSVLSKS